MVWAGAASQVGRELAPPSSRSTSPDLRQVGRVDARDKPACRGLLHLFTADVVEALVADELTPARRQPPRTYLQPS